MKALSIVCTGIILLMVLYFYLAKSVGESIGEELPIAFAKPTTQGVEINIAVPITMPRKAPPLREHGVIMWDKWVETHFIIKDASGKRVPLRRASGSSLMSDRESGGTPDCWLKGFLKAGAAYTFDYKPRLDSPFYRWEFTAPTDGASAERMGFKEVEE